MLKSSWMVDPTRPCEMPNCSLIDLAEIGQCSKFRWWIRSIISLMVTILGRLGRGTTQVEKSPLFKWATQFFTVAYDGEYSSSVTVRIACIPFGIQPSRKKKLVIASVFMLLKSRTLADVFPFSFCKKKRFQIRRMNRSFLPTTLSIQCLGIGK